MIRLAGAISVPRQLPCRTSITTRIDSGIRFDALHKAGSELVGTRPLTKWRRTSNRSTRSTAETPSPRILVIQQFIIQVHCYSHLDSSAVFTPEIAFLQLR